MTVKALYPNLRPSLLLDFANTKDLDPRITFTRTTTARYYDGKTVAKAEENLLLRSQEFNESAWIKEDVTVSANSTTAPDGTSTADLIYPTTTGSTRRISSEVPFPASVTRTLSFYVKANNWQWIVLRSFGAAAGCWIDLTNGVLGTNNNLGSTITITDVGASWYRVVYTGATSITTSFMVVGLVDANESNTATASGTNGVYLWGAQLEQRSSVTAYTPTTTQPVTNYIPALQTAAAGVARFDHNPVTGESLGLLIEEQRSNLLTRSEEFNDAAWTRNNAVLTANQVIAPDGTLTGDKYNTLSTQGPGGSSFRQDVSASPNTTYTASAYIKAGEQTSIEFRFNQRVSVNGTDIGSATVVFNLINGTATSTNTLFTPPTNVSYNSVSVGNGWYRYSITATTTSTVGAVRVAFVNTETGNGFNGIYIWGAQLEAGAFPTSYIKTEGSSVTRNADAASMTGANFSSWYRADEGTLYGEARRIGLGSTLPYIYEVSDGTTNNRNQTIFRADNSISSDTNFNNSPVSSLVIATSVSNNVFYKIATTVKTNDFAGSANGGAVATDTDGYLASFNKIQIGDSTALNRPLNGTIRKLAYYPARLTNAELASLTTV
jgi:hypothetical protein